MTNEPQMTETTTKVRATKYFFIGLSLNLINFGLYTVIVRFIVNNNDLLWLSSLISTLITTILAYVLHSKITWKERKPDKYGIYKFFIWNALIAVAITPFFTWAFGLITPLYEFAYGISTTLHLPFDFNFIQSTGAFAFTSIVTMVLNYLFYDRFIFGKKS